MAGAVLLVDDDPGVRETVRLVLVREGYSVLAASDGEAALDIMTKGEGAKNVCVLLCDLEMPQGGGKELIRKFRVQFPDIPILVMSGAQDTVFLEGIVQEGVCDWLRKPVTRQELVEKVRSARNLYQVRQKQK